MKGKKILLLTLCFVCVVVFADNNVDMMHLLCGGYDAKVMTVAEMDSILASESGQVKSERYRLGYKNPKRLFRHSFLADYYLYDTQKHDTIWLCDEPIRDAAMSPNGKYVVYAKADNNLYIFKVDFQTEVAVTNSKDEGDLMDMEERANTQIFNGVSDWLYEEEFGITSLCAFSPDSKYLAFVRLDEKNVPTFEWQTFLGGDNGQVSNEEMGYPLLHGLRYPRAGESNAVASLCVYDLYYKTIKTIELPVKGECYIPRVNWTVQPVGKDDVANIVALTLNRDQTQMAVYVSNPKSTVSHPFYQEESREYFVDYQLFDEWQWLSDGRVVVVSEKEGYVQAYLYSSQGIEQKKLTTMELDVTSVYGYDEKAQTLYYQAANTPMTRHGYAHNVKKGVTTQLTHGEGTHALHFSKDMKRYIDCFQSLSNPNVYTLHTIGGASRQLLDNDSVLVAWQASGLPNKEFFTFTTERGDNLNGWMIKPMGFEATKRYPVVMMQYSGPASQRVTDTWRKRFGHYLASEGYLVVCVDGRGTNARGRSWRNATYMELGVKEAEDQISTARYLKSLPYIDAERMAICGWSYGGYETLMCLSKQGGETIWDCGIAIAPVTSWRLYDSAYTERYMRRPQVNESGYEKADVMRLAEDMQGQLLLVHGLADDNVHAQQSWLYVDALVQAGKQFEMQFYPDDNHFLRNRSNYEHLHRRIMLFLSNNLK
jgi:dipeptidyl-peptidase-4